MKYLLEHPVVGTIEEQKFKSTIQWRNGVIVSDEPETLGGKDLDIKQVTVRANWAPKLSNVYSGSPTVAQSTLLKGEISVATYPPDQGHIF